MCTSDLFSEDGMIGLLEQAVMLLKEVHVYIVWHKTGSRKLFWIWEFVTSLHFMLQQFLFAVQSNEFLGSSSRAYRGGFLRFQETPFDSRAISIITSLSKYTIINTI